MQKSVHPMRRYLLSLAIMVGMQLAACQGGQGSARLIEVEGKLVLKGNEPFAQAVIVISETEQWLLLGLLRSEIESHQNQIVRVTGEVVHDARPSAARLPSMRVQALSPRLTKPAPAFAK